MIIGISKVHQKLRSLYYHYQEVFPVTFSLDLNYSESVIVSLSTKSLKYCHKLPNAFG